MTTKNNIIKNYAKMSTFQCYRHCVAVIKCCTLNLRSCMASLRTWWCALNFSPHGIPSYNHNALVRITSVLPMGEWPRLEWLTFGQELFPSPVRRIWQLWIVRYTHVPAVVLITARFRCYSKAASVGGMFSRLQYIWANI